MDKVMGAALEGDASTVDRLLGRLSDEELEAWYEAWRLVGLCLGDEMGRRATVEEADMALEDGFAQGGA